MQADVRRNAGGADKFGYGGVYDGRRTDIISKLWQVYSSCPVLSVPPHLAGYSLLVRQTHAGHARNLATRDDHYPWDLCARQEERRYAADVGLEPLGKVGVDYDVGGLCVLSSPDLAWRDIQDWLCSSSKGALRVSSLPPQIPIDTE